MGARVKVVSEIEKIMRNIDQIRNIGIIAHVDHGKRPRQIASWQPLALYPRGSLARPLYWTI